MWYMMVCMVSSREAYRDERSRLLARFGANLHRARSARVPPLSQERLAFITGLHRNEIAKLERGAIEPRISTLLTLAKGLDVSAEELLDGLWAPVERRHSPSSVRRTEGT